MNKVLIVEASESDSRLMSGILAKHGYESIAVGSMEAAKKEVVKLPHGAVIVADYKFLDGSAKELINWMKIEKFTFPVIAVVNNLYGMDSIEVLQDHGAVDVVQRAGMDKQLPDAVNKYSRSMTFSMPSNAELIPRTSSEFGIIRKKIDRISPADANVIIIGESGMGKEQIAKTIYL